MWYSERGAYRDCWLEKLAAVRVSVPKVICKGSFRGYEYLVLTYLEGNDLGAVYPQLSTEDKRAIAKEVVQIQKQVRTLDTGPRTAGTRLDMAHFC